MLTKEIVSAIRGVYSETVARDFKESKVIEFKQINGKDIVECDGCGEIFYLDEVTVHHTIPVVPPQITHKEMSYQLLYSRLFCAWGDLNLLCLPCHQREGMKGEQARWEWVTRKKWLVCRSRIGGKMTVHPLIDLNNLDKVWEVLDVADTRKEADSKFRRWRKS